MTVTIISTWINHPEVVKIHRDLWVSAFPNEIVKYVAYIDAKNHGDFSNFNDTTMKDQLTQACINSLIEYHIVPQELHEQRNKVFSNCQLNVDQTPSGRDALVCQFAWNNEVINRKAERIVLVQSDIFPYKQFTWQSITRGVEFYYKPQRRENNGLYLDYAWEGLCMFDLRTWSDELKEIIDFQHGLQKNVYTDTGGGLWKILEVLPESKKFGWTGQNSLQWNSNDTMPLLPYWIMEHLRLDPRNNIDAGGVIWYYSEIQDNQCFHLRAGGNWDNAGKEIHDTRYSNFIRLLNEAIDDGIVFLTDN